jgi:hypothetical protein
MRRGIQPSQILILMRSDYNGQFSKRIKAELEAREIAFSNPDTVNEILEHEPNRRVG